MKRPITDGNQLVAKAKLQRLIVTKALDLMAVTPDLVNACAVLIEAEGAVFGTEFSNVLLHTAVRHAKRGLRKAKVI